MHDLHCHLDLYEDPGSTAVSTERSGVFTIAVTNLPSNYYSAKPHIRGFNQLKLAVGLHPLLAKHHSQEEKKLFQRAVSETDYIGEVGLDFSPQSLASEKLQLESFRFILQVLQGRRKVISIHSRRADLSVVELLSEFEIGPVVFHWFSGSVTALDEIARKGHFFSINTAMINSEKGQHIVQRIPKERLLTETDGPFVTIGKRPALPADVLTIHQWLAETWQESTKDVGEKLARNLAAHLDRVGLGDTNSLSGTKRHHICC